VSTVGNYTLAGYCAAVTFAVATLICLYLHQPRKALWFAPMMAAIMFAIVMVASVQP
jgi:Ca2+/H+ antiporter